MTVDPSGLQSDRVARKIRSGGVSTREQTVEVARDSAGDLRPLGSIRGYHVALEITELGEGVPELFDRARVGKRLLVAAAAPGLADRQWPRRTAYGLPRFNVTTSDEVKEGICLAPGSDMYGWGYCLLWR